MLAAYTSLVVLITQRVVRLQVPAVVMVVMAVEILLPVLVALVALVQLAAPAEMLMPAV